MSFCNVRLNMLMKDHWCSPLCISLSLDAPGNFLLGASYHDRSCRPRTSCSHRHPQHQLTDDCGAHMSLGQTIPVIVAGVRAPGSPLPCGFAALTGPPESHPIPPRTRSPHRGTHRKNTRTPNPLAHRALGAILMTSTTALPCTCGTELQHMRDAPQKGISLTQTATSFAMIGKSHRVAPAPTITPSMPAQVVEAPVTALRSALRCSRATTPYKVDAWQDFLSRAGLTP